MLADEGNRPSLSDAVRAFFEAEGWPYTQEPADSTLYVGFEGNNGRWMCAAMVYDNLDQFAFYSLVSHLVPDERRVAMAEFLIRANCDLIIGSFDMDFANGQVRFKTSVDVGRSALDQAMIRTLVYTNVQTMGRYFTGIMSVIHTSQTPDQALESVSRWGVPPR